MRCAGWLWLAIAGVALAADKLVVGNFSAGDLKGWDRKSFKGETVYTIAQSDGRTALRAESHAAASGRYREIKVDLRQTPFIHWSWRVDNVLNGVDERSKAGDDYPARVYVVVSGGALFWKTRSLVYVWSSGQPVGSNWENAYTGNARQIAVRSGTRDLGRWLTEKRNIRDDFKRLFGDTIDHIDAVAVMTDTDNSGQAAVAWYGDIVFTSD